MNSIQDGDSADLQWVFTCVENIVSYWRANEHQILFAPGGLVFNGLWVQLAVLQDKIGLKSQALGCALLSCYFVELLKKHA